jgi:hypothetical protein
LHDFRCRDTSDWTLSEYRPIVSVISAVRVDVLTFNAVDKYEARTVSRDRFANHRPR